MSVPFSSYPFDASGIDNFVHPTFINSLRAPTTQDIQNPGTQWMYTSGSTRVLYETTGAGVWSLGGNALATTTTAGIVTLDTYAALAAGTANGTVPLGSDVFTYVNSVAAPVATTTVLGIVELATDVKAVAGTASTALVALAVQPSNLAAVFAAPPTIGNTTPNTGAFTTLGITTLAGAAVGITVSTAAGTGRGISVSSSAVTVPDYASLVGGILVTPTDVAAGASPLTANNRHFKVVFDTVSIAAGATQALVINNSTITGVNTDVMITWSGATTSSAVSLQSIVNGAGTCTLTFTNGTGATTTTDNIQVIGWVMN